MTGPRYYYVYNGHGDVVALTDSSGTVVASYSYDVWGNITSATENIPNANGWTNPYRYDGKDGARYDVETGLYWLSTRAYDPTLGRFLQRDPLGRFPLFFWNQPYVYAGNNPLINVDPSGQRFTDEDILSQETAQQQITETRRTQQVARMMPRKPAPQVTQHRHCDARGAHPTCAQIDRAKQIAAATATQLLNAALNLPILQLFLIGNGSSLLRGFLNWTPPWWIPAALADAAKVLVAGVVTGLTVIMAQLLVASALFEVQSSEPDSFWENAGLVTASESLIEGNTVILGLAVAALGVGIIALTSDPLTAVLGFALIAGGLVGLFQVFQIALNGLTREQQALGY